MQLNHYYIRNDGRVAINLGIGYRKIFNDNYILGVNVFLDADDEDNTRSSFRFGDQVKFYSKLMQIIILQYLAPQKLVLTPREY